MLEGVDILSTSTGYITTFNYSWLFGVAIVALIIGLIFFILMGEVEVIVLSLIIGTFIGSMAVVTAEKVVSEYPIYKVAISKDVNFTEFNDRYEILGQDDKIYTIKERDEK